MSKSLRKSPSDSATVHPIGTIMRGLDGQNWVVDKTKIGIHRWTPQTSSTLNGMMILTTDYLSKNINKSITLYLREYINEWPKKEDWIKKIPTHETITFKPTGNAIVGKSVINNWLKKQDTFKKGLSVEGYISFYSEKEHLSSLQVDSKNKKTVSTNLMNTEVFIKV